MGVSWTYRYFFSRLYVGLSTRYRYLIMVLSSVMVESSFILVLERYFTTYQAMYCM